VPYSSLESVIEQNKQAYYVALRQTQGTIRTEEPNWQSWITFFLSSLCSQIKNLEEKMANEHQLLATLPAIAVQLIDLARKQGRITLIQAVELTGANRNTIRANLKKLVADGHLKQHGITGRGVWYGLL
jgi:Fic family protein